MQSVRSGKQLCSRTRIQTLICMISKPKAIPLCFAAGWRVLKTRVCHGLNPACHQFL